MTVEANGAVLLRETAVDLAAMLSHFCLRPPRKRNGGPKESPNFGNSSPLLTVPPTYV